MSVYLKYLETEEKLEKLCSENQLQLAFKRNKYPIIFRFEPLWEKVAQQRIDGLEDDGGRFTDPDASIELIFDDELIVQITKGFTIDDDVLTKLKNTSKSLHYLHLQIWFRKTMEAEQHVSPQQGDDIVDVDETPAEPLMLKGDKQSALPPGNADETDDE